MPENIENHTRNANEYAEYLRQRSLNAKLTKAAFISGMAASIGIVVGGLGLLAREDARRVAVDPIGRAHNLTLLKHGSRPK